MLETPSLKLIQCLHYITTKLTHKCQNEVILVPKGKKHILHVRAECKMRVLTINASGS